MVSVQYRTRIYQNRRVAEIEKKWKTVDDCHEKNSITIFHVAAVTSVISWKDPHAANRGGDPRAEYDKFDPFFGEILVEYHMWSFTIQLLTVGLKTLKIDTNGWKIRRRNSKG